MTAADWIATEPHSPFNAFIGFEIVDWGPDFCRVDLPIRPEHLNRSGVVHGGVLMSLLDTVCGFAGLFPKDGNRRFGLTLSITTQFIGQASGDRLIATARRKGGGNSVYFAAGEVHDTAGALVATAEGTFRYRKSYGAAEAGA
jgi:uncharacterized protein (TIGR00369 family)